MKRMKGERPITEQGCRFALALALQVMTHTSPEKLVDLYEIAYGHRIEKAHAVACAGMLAKHYETLLSEFDSRNGIEQEKKDLMKDSHQEDPA